MKTWLAVIICAFWLASCESSPETTLSPEQKNSRGESSNEFNPLSFENRRLRSALVFLSNKEKYSAAQLRATEAPKKEFFQSLDCLRQCRADTLSHFEKTGGFNRKNMRKISQAIQELICVPLSSNMPSKNMPSKSDRTELLNNIPDYDPVVSQMVVCHKQNSDMVIHIKNDKIIKIFE